MAATAADQVKRLVAAKYPLLYLLSWEERRVEAILKKIADSGFSSPFKFFTWSKTDGLVTDGKAIPDTQDPIRAMDYVMRAPDAGLFVFRDLHDYFNQRHPNHAEVIRKLRDIYHICKNNFKTLFILSPLLRVPEILSKELMVIDFELPGVREMSALLESVLQANKALAGKVPEDLKQQLAHAALGLTIDEAKSAYLKTAMGKTQFTANDVANVYEEKRQLVRKEGLLEFIDNRNFTVESIGGMDNLKEWLELRRKFFSKEAEDFGISAPKGVLLTGIPGCGKSVCIRAIASHWALPLFRLDMDRVYGAGDSPEDALRRVFQTVEAAAPACLWIDEIEKGMSGYGGGGGGGATEARVFGMFLTWMQDKKSMVFIAATANEVDKLPPEILRKGRFDEIFFVDLPNESERKEIFTIHLKNCKQDPERFDLQLLSKGTNGFTGSEIEQVVRAGLYEAFAAKRELTNNDLHKVAGRMVALSVTMAESIKDLKRWAQYRAVKATKTSKM